jgi:hypothetical protein
MGLFSRPDPRPQIIGDKPLHCLVCNHDRFYSRDAQLNTAGAELLGFAWANQSATCYVCAECGYIHWFLLDE